MPSIPVAPSRFTLQEVYVLPLTEVPFVTVNCNLLIVTPFCTNSSYCVTLPRIFTKILFEIS